MNCCNWKSNVSLNLHSHSFLTQRWYGLAPFQRGSKCHQFCKFFISKPAPKIYLFSERSRDHRYSEASWSVQALKLTCKTPQESGKLGSIPLNASRKSPHHHTERRWAGWDFSNHPLPSQCSNEYSMRKELTLTTCKAECDKPRPVCRIDIRNLWSEIIQIAIHL